MSIIKTGLKGNKGTMSIQVVPSVSIDALSASSMNSEGETISLTEPVFDTVWDTKYAIY